MSGLLRSNAETARATRQYALQLHRWALAFSRLLARQEAGRLRELGAKAYVRKQDSADEERAKEELRRLMLRFGIRQMADAAMRETGAIGRPISIPGSLVHDAIAGKPVKLKWFWQRRGDIIERVEVESERIKNEVRESVKEIVRAGMKEPRQPSMGELARRIHEQAHGPDGLFAFSPERAALIAQTELAQSENTGIYEGYKEVGIEEIEWLAHRDGRSGDRHHEKMHKVRVRVGEYFTTPLGNKLRYPGDPMGPIKETISCRCTTRAVIQRRKSS
jgi:hypothetical protein